MSQVPTAHYPPITRYPTAQQPRGGDAILSPSSSRAHPASLRRWKDDLLVGIQCHNEPGWLQVFRKDGIRLEPLSTVPPHPSSHSIVSTCLDVSPDLIATGLSTGNLCLHRLKEEWDFVSDVYSATRQRPATAVKWRPSMPTQIALGQRPRAVPATESLYLWDSAQARTPIRHWAPPGGVFAMDWLSSDQWAVASKALTLGDPRQAAFTASVPLHSLARDLVIHKGSGDSTTQLALALHDRVQVWDVRQLEAGAVVDLKLSQARLVRWRNEQLLIATSDTLWTYDVQSRPLPTQRLPLAAPVQDMELDEHRTWLVHEDRSVSSMALHRLAPLAVRETRVAHGWQKQLWVENQGETLLQQRARLGYAMDVARNLTIVQDDLALVRLWQWMQRVKDMWRDQLWDDHTPVFAGWRDVGVWHLLRSEGSTETKDNPWRRAALSVCGWAGKQTLESVLQETEATGEYERAAALAVWHDDVGAAVEVLQRGASALREKSREYAETLDLVALCIAGHRGGEPDDSPSFQVWKRASDSLLKRESFENATGQTIYVHAMLKTLMSNDVETHRDDILSLQSLSLSDRIGFACRFLEKPDLLAFLEQSISECKISGSLEGLVATGIDQNGIQILQSYMDRTNDVQTAALVTGRVIFPKSWSREKAIAEEWLDGYRNVLNTCQMWHCRAMFDVERAELLRKTKERSAAQEEKGRNRSGSITSSGRRGSPTKARRAGPKTPDRDVQANVPVQLEARCNYCSAPLGLHQNSQTTSQWLSKMKPVLSCCPQCRKPLPRCSICLLSLGALNPYLELTKDRTQSGSSSSSSNLPFAEWYTWCLRCKHGGHAHHWVGWYAQHETCPVSGCDCQCQFDGVPELSTTATTKTEVANSSQ